MYNASDKGVNATNIIHANKDNKGNQNHNK